MSAQTYGQVSILPPAVNDLKHGAGGSSGGVRSKWEEVERQRLYHARWERAAGTVASRYAGRLQPESIMARAKLERPLLPRADNDMAGSIPIPTRWSNTYGSFGVSTWDEGRCAAYDLQRNALYVAGRSFGADQFDIVLVRYNARTGDTLWIQRYDGTGHANDEPRRMALDSLGNIYIAGGSDGSGNVNYDYIVLKYSPEGELLWSARYDDPEHDLDDVMDMAITPGGIVYVTGYASTKCATIRYNADGKEAWIRFIGTTGTKEYGEHVAVDAKGNVHVVHLTNGVGWSLATYDSLGNVLPTPGITVPSVCLAEVIDKSRDRLLLVGSTINAYDLSAGRSLWSTAYPGGQYYWADPLRVVYDTASANLYVAGTYYSSGGGNDFQITKYDSLGSLKWDQRYDGPRHGDDRIYDAALASDGGLFVSGISQDSLPAGAPYSYVIVHYSEDSGRKGIMHFPREDGFTYDSPAVAADSAGGVFAVGFDQHSSQIHMLTVHYDGGSQQTWLQIYEGPPYSEDIPAGIAMDRDGNTFVSISGILPKQGQAAITLKYEAQTGNILWKHTTQGEALDLLLDTCRMKIYVPSLFTDTQQSIILNVEELSPQTGNVCWQYRTVIADSAGNYRWPEALVKMLLNEKNQELLLIIRRQDASTKSSFAIARVALSNGHEMSLHPIKDFPHASGIQDAVIDAYGNIDLACEQFLWEQAPPYPFVFSMDVGGEKRWMFLDTVQGGGCRIAIGDSGNVYFSRAIVNRFWGELALSKIGSDGTPKWTRMLGSASDSIDLIPVGIFRTTSNSPALLVGESYRIRSNNVVSGRMFVYTFDQSQGDSIMLAYYPEREENGGGYYLSDCSYARADTALYLLGIDFLGGYASEAEYLLGKFNVASNSIVWNGGIDSPGVDRTRRLRQILMTVNGDHSDNQRMIAISGIVGSADARAVTIQYLDPGGSPVTSVGTSKQKRQFVLSQNYPNPFNPSTIISYQIPKEGFVSLKIYNLLGQEVATLVNEEKQPGEYKVRWDGTSVPSGVYFYRMTAGTYKETKKLLLVK